MLSRSWSWYWDFGLLYVTGHAHVWNSLLSVLGDKTLSLKTFIWKLKSYLFCRMSNIIRCCCRISCGDFGAVYNCPTFLLTFLNILSCGKATEFLWNLRCQPTALSLLLMTPVLTFLPRVSAKSTFVTANVWRTAAAAACVLRWLACAVTPTRLIARLAWSASHICYSDRKPSSLAASASCRHHRDVFTSSSSRSAGKLW